MPPRDQGSAIAGSRPAIGAGRSSVAIDPTASPHDRPLALAERDRRRTFNVKAFGAAGDGITDDTRSVQAAIDAAVGAGGGIAYVPPGTYRVSTPPRTVCADQPHCAALHLHGSDVALMGAGRGVSTLTNGNELNILVRVGRLESGPVGPVNGVTISGLRFSNSSAPQPSAAGGSLVHVDTRRGTVEHTLIEDIFIDGSGLTGVTIHGSHNTLRRSWIRNTAEHGVYMAGDHTTKKLTVGQAVLDNVIEYPSSHPLSATVHSFADGIKVTRTHHGLVSNNSITLSDEPSEGINVEDSSHTMSISGNRIVLGGPNQSAIRVSAADVDVSGGTVDGAAGDTNSIGVDVRDTARSSVVRGVTFTGNWQTSVLIQRAGARDVVFRELTLKSAPDGGWAIELTSALRPTVERSAILAGSHGINLGTSDGARLIKNRILSQYKYGMTGPPRNYTFE